MTNAYRSAYEHIIETRIEAVRHTHEAAESWEAQLRSVRSARIARIAGAGVALGGVAAMCLLAALQNGAEVHVLLASPFLGLLTYVMVRVGLAAVRRYVRVVPPFAVPALTGVLDADLAAIDRSDPAEAISHRLSALETWSVALPLVATGFLAPLSLHYVAGCAIHWNADRTSVLMPAEDYTFWVRVSLAIVGHAHVALAVMAVLFARKMRRMAVDDLASCSVHRDSGLALLVTVIVSCVPGFVFMMVPPVLTLLTGAAFIPFMYVTARSIVLRERLVVVQASDAVRAAAA